MKGAINSRLNESVHFIAFSRVFDLFFAITVIDIDIEPYTICVYNG